MNAFTIKAAGEGFADLLFNGEKVGQIRRSYWIRNGWVAEIKNLELAAVVIAGGGSLAGKTQKSIIQSLNSIIESK